MSRFFWIHGLPGAGKTTTGKLLYEYMKKQNYNVILLDGDYLRDLFENYDYTASGRDHVMKMTLKFVTLLLGQDTDVILCNCAMENKYRQWCQACSKNLREIFLDVSIQELIRRDQKHLYSRALKGEIQNVRGINMPYEIPESAELVIKNDLELMPQQVVEVIIKKFNL